MIKTLVALGALIPLSIANIQTVSTDEDNITLHDFNGNEFYLVKNDYNYEIYDKNGVFIEGALDSTSPYTNYEGDFYYLGPTNYFVVNNDVVYDIFNNSYKNISNYNGLSYEIQPVIGTRSSNPTPDINETYVDYSGYVLVNKADYFKNLTYFPKNWFGECGIISLSILLSYYDTFYNDEFIPNDLKYDGRYYTKKSTRSSNENDFELTRTVNETLIRKSTTSYKETETYSFKDWSYMPGTNYAMRDYIFDNYKHTYMGLGWDNVGYPMLDGELKNTLQDYMKANCNNLVGNTEFRSGNVFYTHQRPKEYIAAGNPTCLVLKSYNTETIGNGNNHVVIAYGYNGDKFLTHFGWGPDTKTYTQVILNSATIYGYFSIKYNGEHKCSSNVKMTNGSTTKYICGCGNVHE